MKKFYRSDAEIFFVNQFKGLRRNLKFTNRQHTMWRYFKPSKKQQSIEHRKLTVSLFVWLASLFTALLLNLSLFPFGAHFLQTLSRQPTSDISLNSHCTLCYSHFSVSIMYTSQPSSHTWLHQYYFPQLFLIQFGQMFDVIVLEKYCKMERTKKNIRISLICTSFSWPFRIALLCFLSDSWVWVHFPIQSFEYHISIPRVYNYKRNEKQKRKTKGKSENNIVRESIESAGCATAAVEQSESTEVVGYFLVFMKASRSTVNSKR